MMGGKYLGEKKKKEENDGEEKEGSGGFLNLDQGQEVHPNTCDTTVTRHIALGYSKYQKSTRTGMAIEADWNNLVADTLNA